MAVTIVAGSVVAASSSVVITKPTGVAQGDLLLAVINSNTPSTAPTPPTGWTNLDNSHDNNSWSTLCYLIAGASEPSSYTWTQGTGSIFNVWGCLALRAGAGGTLGIDANSHTGGSNATTLTPASLTASLAGDALILMLTDSADVAVSTWPSGVTERTDASNATGNGVDTGTKLSLGTGSTGSLATTIGASAGDEDYFAILVKETPAAATGPNMGTIGGARGQWPNAPLRTTQRLPLTRIEHNVAPASAGSLTGGGIAASDLTYDNAAQFYGDGTQTSTIKPPYGAWPVTPLRAAQRTAFTWQPHNTGDAVNEAGLAGVATNDLLTVPPGETYQFFGIPDAVDPQPLDPTPTGIVVNAALVESSAQLVSPSGDTLIANAVL
ncbi:MAG TPA: hypothetical protein VGR57_00155, partial [Ktedonobacterales bacterium]|nr:hypothetical protein [Ktedonobacterales bacterium]